MNQATRKEWRDLGFFHHRDHTTKGYQFIGSRAGLLRFRDLLLEYAADPSNDYESEHDHYGPYYLEIMTWPEAGFDEHGIRGSLQDLKRLAAIVESHLAKARPGETIRIQSEYATTSPYALVLLVREDGFDPASADPALPKEIRL